MNKIIFSKALMFGGNNLKKIAGLILSLIIILSGISFSASAEGYTYGIDGKAQVAPDAVTVKEYIDINSLGLDIISELTDICVDNKGYLYICDGGNNRVIILKKDYSLECVIDSLIDKTGSSQKLSAPQGVFVDDNFNIYISDRDNGRIIECEKNGNIKNIITVTPEEVYNNTFIFKPLKAVADKYGNVYVLSSGSYDGLLQFDSNGNFIGYVGSNEISPDIMDIIWKKIFTQTQREQYAKTIPVEFTSLDIDNEGFIYTVTATITDTPESGDPVRKQTAKGNNILKTSNLFGKAIGDLEFPISWDKVASVKGSSAFVDVSASQDYGFACLDSNGGKVFVYNEDSDLLCTFGGKGSVVGRFQKPIAIASFEDEILILDEQTSCITVFKFTEYGKSILDAQSSYMQGRYDESEKQWKSVLKQNSNLIIGYSGIAKVYMMQGKYSEAMKYAKLGGDQKTYSKAFKYNRQEMLSDNFIYMIIGVAALFLGLYIVWKIFGKRIAASRVVNSKTYKGIKFGGYIMTHPFKGFWDMNHERKGNMVSAGIIYAIFVLTVILQKQFTAFLFVDVTEEFRLIPALCTALVPVVLWNVCNWSVSTLTDGDGNPKDIIMSTAYSLVPYIIFTLIAITLSHFLASDEAVFLTVLNLFAVVWTAFLLLAATITVHDFTLIKAIGTMIITVIGIAVVIFLTLLVFNLVQQMCYFIVSIYNQLIIRM